MLESVTITDLHVVFVGVYLCRQGEWSDECYEPHAISNSTRWVRGCDLCCTWVVSALPGELAKPPRLCHPPDTRGTSAAAAGTSYAEQKKRDIGTRKTFCKNRKGRRGGGGRKKMMTNELPRQVSLTLIRSDFNHRTCLQMCTRHEVLSTSPGLFYNMKGYLKGLKSKQQVPLSYHRYAVHPWQLVQAQLYLLAINSKQHPPTQVYKWKAQNHRHLHACRLGLWCK